jgi:hypothetical protein
MMLTSKDDLSISNMQGGNVAARIDLTIEEIVKNCLDPNYDTSARKIKITLEIRPNSRRDEIYIVPKIRPEKGNLILAGAAATIGIDSSGRAVAREFVDPQQKLFESNVTPIRPGMPSGQE